MKSFLSLFLSAFKWYRRWHGGKWAFVYVDHPVCSHMWLPIPIAADRSYREPLWRGMFEFEDWTTP